MLAVVFSFNAGFFRFNMVIFLCTFVLAALAAVIIFVGAAAEGTLAIRLVWFFCRIWLDCFVDLAITAIPTTFSRILISSITIESQAIAAVPTTRCLVGLFVTIAIPVSRGTILQLLLGSKEIAALDIVPGTGIFHLELVRGPLSRADGVVGCGGNASVPPSNASDIAHANREAVGTIRMQLREGRVADAFSHEALAWQLLVPSMHSFVSTHPAPPDPV